MALWRLYYHLVWATKERQLLITNERERKIYSYIISKADELETIIHAINGTENHIHIVASIPPKISISEFVQKIKGSSTHYINNVFSLSDMFAWQRGYGVFSLGRKQLEEAVIYVKNQKEHHAQNTIIKSLENFNQDDDPPQKFDM